MKVDKKQRSTALPPQVVALVQETEQDLPDLMQNIDPLIRKLKSLSPSEQEVFFGELIKRELPELTQLLTSIQGKDENIDLALINTLGFASFPQAGGLLQDLAAHTRDKKLRKAIRRSLFRLKSKGVKVGEIPDQEPAIFIPLKWESSQAFVGAPEGNGLRLVFITQPRLPKKILLFQLLLSEEEGVTDFSVRDLSKKLAAEYLAIIKRDIFPLAEIDPNYALGLIMESIAAGQKTGQNPPPELTQWMSLLGSPPPLPLKPIIYQFLSAEEINNRRDLLDRSSMLFEIEPINYWFLEKEELQKYYELYKEAATSRLILSPQQKEDRLQDIYALAAQEIFDQSKRFRFRRRLEEMAYILLKLGKEYEARICLAAALALDKESGLLAPHKFLTSLVQRSLEMLWTEEEEKEEKRESNLIIDLPRE